MKTAKQVCKAIKEAPAKAKKAHNKAILDAIIERVENLGGSITISQMRQLHYTYLTFNESGNNLYTVYYEDLNDEVLKTLAAKGFKIEHKIDKIINKIPKTIETEVIIPGGRFLWFKKKDIIEKTIKSITEEKEVEYKSVVISACCE